MRLLRAAVAAYLLLALVAQARVAIICDNTGNNATTAAANLRNEEHYTRDIGLGFVTAFLNRYNPGSYDVYTSSQIWTQLIKSGKVSLSDRGSTTGPYATYTGVIWVGTAGMSASNNANHVGCAACSLTFISNSAAAAVPTVPQMFLGGIVENETGFSTAATCSTNCGGSGFDPGSQGPDYFDGRHHLIGSAKGWPAQPGELSGNDCFDLASVARASGTYRVLLGMDGANLAVAPANSNVRQPKPAWRDSIRTWSATDPSFTVAANDVNATGPSNGIVVWTRYNDNFSGAAPNIFVHWGAHHTPVMGGGTTTSTDSRVQPDPVPIYIALAWMDSVMSRGLLGTTIEPAKLAVQISGGFRRGLASSSGGFAPFDTTTVGASLDSLRVLGIPFSVGVNVDSISTYASDQALWRRGGSPHFTLESWDGIADSTKGAGAASAGTFNPSIVDPFGRFRKRVFVGATSDTTDTSTAGLLKRGKLLLASRLGIGFEQIDKIVIAAQDDYSPVNKLRGGADSVALALTTAGFTGVAQNADDSLGTGTAPSTTNLWGYGSTPRFLGNAMFLTFPGFNPRGSTYGNGTGFNGNGSPCDSSWCMAYANRTMFGLYNNFWETPQKYPWLKNASPAAMTAGSLWWTEPGIHAEISPKSNIKTGVNLIRISASSLGSGESASSPNMPGYYTLKYIKYQVDAINSFGRNLIVFTYPDGLGPRDIRR